MRYYLYENNYLGILYTTWLEYVLRVDMYQPHQ